MNLQRTAKGIRNSQVGIWGLPPPNGPAVKGGIWGMLRVALRYHYELMKPAAKLFRPEIWYGCKPMVENENDEGDECAEGMK